MTQREEFEEWYETNYGFDLSFYRGQTPNGIDGYIFNNDNKATALSTIAYQAYRAAKSQAVPEWISVSDRLPEEEGTYFCLGHNGTAFVCLFRATKYEGKFWLRSTGIKRIYGITHWMPLPAAPEQNK